MADLLFEQLILLGGCMVCSCHWAEKFLCRFRACSGMKPESGVSKITSHIDIPTLIIVLPNTHLEYYLRLYAINSKYQWVGGKKGGWRGIRMISNTMNFKS